VNRGKKTKKKVVGFAKKKKFNASQPKQGNFRKKDNQHPPPNSGKKNRGQQKTVEKEGEKKRRQMEKDS